MLADIFSRVMELTNYRQSFIKMLWRVHSMQYYMLCFFSSFGNLEDMVLWFLNRPKFEIFTAKSVKEKLGVLCSILLSRVLS